MSCHCDELFSNTTQPEQSLDPLHLSEFKHNLFETRDAWVKYRREYNQLKKYQKQYTRMQTLYMQYL